MSRRLLTLFILCGSLFLLACGPVTSGERVRQPVAARSRLNVISTVAPIVNIVYNIGGDRIQVSGLIPEGSDSHTFEPAPGDAIRLYHADIIFVNGLALETPTLKLAEANRRPGSEVISLGELAVSPDQYVYDFSFPREQGHPNPHLWMNPLLALRYAEIVRDTLSRRDPANSSYYQDTFGKFKARISLLDDGILQSILTVPEKNRRLVTYHDSFAYFAQRYPVVVVGAVQPANFAEPSARDVVRLIEQLKREKVPAVFGSEVFPSKILEQIARESGTLYVDSLRDDQLPGKAGDRQHSYLGMIIENVATMVGALGGDSAPVSSIDPSNVPGPDLSVDQAQ